MFGWHVHEKAILLPVIPLGLIASDNAWQRKMYILMATIGQYALFPLLFTVQETPIKIFLLISHITFSMLLLGSKASDFTLLEKAAIFWLIPVQIFTSIVHPLLLAQQAKYEFLPLLVVSVYCALVLVWLWLKYAVGILLSWSPSQATSLASQSKSNPPSSLGKTKAE